MKFAIATVMLVGCVASDEMPVPPAPPVEPVPAAPPVQAHCEQQQIAQGGTSLTSCYQPEQGRNILGITADRLKTTTSHIAAVSQSALTVDPTTRELRVGGTPLTGTVELGTNNPLYRFQITGPGPEYTVSYREVGVQPTTWHPLCTSPEESARAIEGRWDLDGNHRAAVRTVTFSCVTRGKAAWCEGLGYRPTTPQGTALHQACVQMATANYCNDGVSHTREKTPVVVRDSAGIQGRNVPPHELTRFPGPPFPRLMPVVPPAPSAFFLEGIWLPNRPVYCLSKFRWAEMPASPCPNELPDPRLGTGGVYCEDVNLDTIPSSFYLLNGSRVMDVALHTWSNTAGTDTITSVNGVVYDGRTRGTTDHPNRMIPPTGTNEGFMLRSLTGEMRLADMIPVYRLVNLANGDTVAAPANIPELALYTPVSGTALPAGTADAETIGEHPDYEGLLVGNYPGQTIAWTLYRKGQDFVTATAKPNGFTPVRDLGYVIAAGP
jgi:hypothetical protein